MADCSGPLARADVERIERLLPFLRYDGGALTVDGIDAENLLDEGSPVLAYVTDRAVENYRELTLAFQQRWPRTSVYFAVKSCYVGPMLRALAQAGAGFEVMSEIELALALNAGSSPVRILSTGIGRDASYVAAVEAARPGLVVIDNLDDLQATVGSTIESRFRPPVALRAAPADPSRSRYTSRSTKLGATVYDGAFGALLDAALAAPVEVVGLHCHTLGHCRDPEIYGSAVRDVVEIARQCERTHGVRFLRIDIGGGLDARFLIEHAGYPAVDFASAAAVELERVGYDFDLLLEPGRFVSGDAAVALTTVIASKVSDGRHTCVVDVSSNVLIPRPSIDYPAVPLRLDPYGAWLEFDIADRTCTPNLLTSGAALPPRAASRCLALLNCGAYTSVFAELWAFPLPRIVCIEGGQPRDIFGYQAERRMWRLLHGLDVAL